MRLHRFIGKFDLNQNDLLIEDKELISQINKVLRLKSGDRIILSDGNSNEALAEIQNEPAEKGRKFGKTPGVKDAPTPGVEENFRPRKSGTLIIKIIERYKNESEPIKKVKLYCAVLKKENFELVVQKATEAGVSEIIPIITERTVKTNLNIERLQKITKEAAEQSGRGIIPILHEPIKFEQAIEQAKKNNQKNILFDKSGIPLLTTNYLLLTAVGIFVGPEGGFSESEVSFAKENGFQIASLGLLTLRAETAAIISTYIISQ